MPEGPYCCCVLIVFLYYVSVSYYWVDVGHPGFFFRERERERMRVCAIVCVCVCVCVVAHGGGRRKEGKTTSLDVSKLCVCGEYPAKYRYTVCGCVSVCMVS